MSFTLIIEPEAEADLALARAWHDEQAPGKGDVFLDQVEHSFALIVRQPRLFPIIHRQARIITMDRFAWGVLYRIDGTRVVVLAIFHLRSNPDNWRQRL